MYIDSFGLSNYEKVSSIDKCGDDMKAATFEQFCKHYKLDEDDKNSMTEYQKYLNNLAFTESLFNQG